MIPRLAPRSSRRNSLELPGLENHSPSWSRDLLAEKPQLVDLAPPKLPSKTVEQQNAHLRGAAKDGGTTLLSQRSTTNSTDHSQPLKQSPPTNPRPALSAMDSTSLHAPLSPPRGSTEQSFLIPDSAFKSPVSTQHPCIHSHHQEPTSNTPADWSITPPVTGPRPLIVSAKRLGKAVRRQHSKRRRFRTSSKTLSNQGSSHVTHTSATPANDNHHTSVDKSTTTLNDGAQCLWKDANAPPSQETLSSDEDDDNHDDEQDLPFLFSEKHPKRLHVPIHEQNLQFWEYCYGKGTAPTTTTTTTTTTAASSNVNSASSIIQSSAESNGTLLPGWSAKRAPPIKGCLSSKKTPRQMSSSSTRSTSFKTPPGPSRHHHHSHDTDGHGNHMQRKGPRVQFGSPQAAEYEIDGPTAQLTPLPSHVIRSRYSMEAQEPSQAEEEMTLETKQNSLLLAAWEQDFDEDDDNDNDNDRASRRSKRRSSSSRHRQRRKDRRSSALFTPSPMALLDNPESESNNISPSVMVMENLAALCVASPGDKGQQAVATNESATEMTSQSTTCIKETLPSDHSFKDDGTTQQFAIDLQSVNTIGGAMDISPSRNDSPSSHSHKPLLHLSASADTTPPPTNASLDTIHSVGGALDGASPGNTPPPIVGSTNDRHSPISRMSHSTGCSPNGLGGTATETSSQPMDIVRILLNDPSSDQEWPPSDVFKCLANNIQPKKRQIHRVLEQLGLQDGAMACLDDLKEQARFCASTKSNTKFKLPQSKKSYALGIVAREWMHLEIELLEELTNVVKTGSERRVAMLHRTGTAMKEWNNDTTQKKQSPQQLQRALEAEIATLEARIKRQETILSQREAETAPLAALQCQAIAHIGMCGFRIDEYTGACLRLTFEHPIVGVESQCVLDMSNGTWSGTVITSAMTTNSSDPLAPSHVAATWHVCVLHHVFQQGHALLHGLEEMEVQDAVLNLSRWFGQLDMAAMDLATVANECHVRLDFPKVSITSSVNSNDWEICMNYGTSTIRTFHPCSVYISRPGNDPEMLDCPSAMNSNPHYIQTLVQKAKDMK